MSDLIKFYVPADIEKATDAKGKEVMRFKGLASDPNKDSQGENLDPSGMDLSAFKWVNWNHLGTKDAAAIIGEVAKSQVTSENELHIEGLLYPGVPMAKSAWALMKALQESPSGNKLSLSVEGKVLKRASDDPKHPGYNKIIKSKITGVALCPTPINGNTWANIMKGEILDKEEEYDEETQKAMTAVSGEHVTTKEDVEGPKNKVLKKSDIYERIYDKYPEITIQKAQSVYSLIENVTIMETNTTSVSDETIKKAFALLDIVKAEKEETKEEKEKKTAEKEKVEKAEKENKEKEEEECDDKEMVKKAHEVYKGLITKGSPEAEVKAALMKKGYGEGTVEKAMKMPIQKAETVNNDTLSKAEVAELFKAETTPLIETFKTSFSAIGEILKAQMDQNTQLKKAFDSSIEENKDLFDKMKVILKTPEDRKSLAKGTSYTERFAKSEGTDNKTFNINSPVDRKALGSVLTDKSGINKGDGNFDTGIMGIAQELEIAKGLTPQSIARLKSMDINIVME